MNQLFDASEIDTLCAEDVVAYSNSLQRLYDDRESIRYYGEQQKQAGVEAGKKEGIKEGIKEGMRTGLLEGMRQVAQKMKMMGEDLLKIKDITGLSIKEIEAL